MKDVIENLDLSGTWQLRDATSEYNLDIQIPGDVITALFDANLIPDPYVGKNEYDVRWVAERDWVLERQIDVQDTNLSLKLSGLDCISHVEVNGTSVLVSKNTYRRFSVDLSDVLVLGSNLITITLKSPVHAAAAAQAEQAFRQPYSKNCPIPDGNMLRKPACDFGWDWNIALAPMGVVDFPSLITNKVQFGDLNIKQHHSAGAVTVQIHQPVTGQGEWSLTFAGQEASGTIANGAISARFLITDPDLWWPSGMGPQTLHKLEINVDSQSVTHHIGLCQIDHISKPDTAGRSFGFRVNGIDTFARGANWIPADALPGRIDPVEVRKTLQSAVDANMNMIRVWGGGRYEPDWFYEMCSELGLMVWQDFMFACNLYPADPDFLAEVDAEVRDVVSRLQKHPCLALWCGDNELIGALTWYEESIKDRDRYLVAYDRLNRTIESALLETDPTANWWPSSPSPGPLSFGDAWHDDSSGDMHFWSVWHEGRDFYHYRDVSPRFCSEFGFQSYPSMDVVHKFAKPEDQNIASPVMESHQKNTGGNARIAETMFREYRFPVDFPNFVYLSQIQQGEAIRTAVTYWRSLKPHCMGALYWQLNDTWPVCSWSSLDHGGGWKLLHHMARRFFAPIMVTLVPVEQGFELRGVNDQREPFASDIKVIAVNSEGHQRELLSQNLQIPSDHAVTGPVITDANSDEVLQLSWSTPAGVEHEVYPVKHWKEYNLVDPGLTHTTEKDGEGWTMTLSANAPAFLVAVESDQPGRFSDNVFAVLPGQPVILRFVPDHDGAKPNFTVRDLRSATYAQ